MEKLELTLTVSLGRFVFGDDISNYLDLPHTVEHVEESGLDPYDSYEFPEQHVDVCVENQKIEFITCDTYCFWRDENLIGMAYDRFLSLLDGQQPDREDVCYVPVSRDRGQNQKVYDFENLGLQIWVWRNKIKTVIASSEILDD